MKIADVCNYADDATFLAFDSDLKTPDTRLEREAFEDVRD